MPDLVLHAFTDGRDTLPSPAPAISRRCRAGCARRGRRRGSARSSGRYWAMDRDRRWDRTQRAYDLLVHGEAPSTAASGRRRRAGAYERDETDEFISRCWSATRRASARATRVFALQLPPDRMRQIMRALAEPDVRRGRPRRRAGRRALRDDDRVRGGLALPGGVPARAPGRRRWPGCWPSAAMRQLHVAETEKYAHVTYFFNGGEEDPFEGERRELVASPRDVPDLRPQAGDERAEAAEAFVAHWRDGRGRRSGSSTSPTPTWSATPGDRGRGAGRRDGRRVPRRGGLGRARVRRGVLVTADHGNADHMLEPDGSPNTAHSLNPVPLIVTVPGADGSPARASSPTSRRPSWSCWASSSPRRWAGESMIGRASRRARGRGGRRPGSVSIASIGSDAAARSCGTLSAELRSFRCLAAG